MSTTDTRAAISLERILPRLAMHVPGVEDDPSWPQFKERLEANFATLFTLLVELYGGHYDFFYHLETIVATAARTWFARPDDLKALDARRAVDPDWFQSQHMLGAMCYVDR